LECGNQKGGKRIGELNLELWKAGTARNGAEELGRETEGRRSVGGKIFPVFLSSTFLLRFEISR
jgi:hypothetical protein